METALARLPHGPEFRFIDRLTALEPGRSGTGEYRVHGDEPFLAGHFPGDPMMPGVLLVEAVAQLAGVVGQSDPEAGALPGLRLTAIQQAKILGAAKPGETLEITVEIEGRMGSMFQARGGVTTAGRPLLQVRVTLAGTEVK